MVQPTLILHFGQRPQTFPSSVCTFSSGEHGGGQLTLLCLYVAECEPAVEAVGQYMVGSSVVSGGGCGLQNWQPKRAEWKKKTLLVLYCAEKWSS